MRQQQTRDSNKTINKASPPLTDSRTIHLGLRNMEQSAQCLMELTP